MRPGLGALDYRTLLTEMERPATADTPILVEHLGSAAEYAAAVAHVRGVADTLGLASS